ncbi:MAG: hypothetical protein J6U96_01735 [Elusimicrobiaceae bacterium]|nr:hypothetical protein [Elusimicrobiaceae bacterium]
MPEKANKRSNMLLTIYQMLPNISDDYAAKLVYTLEKKKSVFQLQQDIADTSLQLGTAVEIADTLVAQILLSEITVPAALHQLRIYQNGASIMELADALPISPTDTDLLLHYYASIGAAHFFDTAFAETLEKLPIDQTLPDTEKAKQIVKELLAQAKQDVTQNPQQAQQNKKDIYRLVEQYHLSLQNTAALLKAYTVTGAGKFVQLFDQLFQTLQALYDNPSLNAFLSAKTLLCKITPKEAQDITLTAKLLKANILKEDLIAIACRHLTLKTPKDIADTFQAILQRLRHTHQTEENLGLAVRTLLDEK